MALVQASGNRPARPERGAALAANRAWCAAEQPVGDRRRRGPRRPAGCGRASAEYIDSQYTGAKAALRPIYDRLAAAIEDFGDDVSVEGRGSYTPFVRGRQFAAVAAATRDRVDLGLRFTDPPAADRLQPGQRAPGRLPIRSRCAAWVTSTTRCCTCSAWPTNRTPESEISARPSFCLFLLLARLLRLVAVAHPGSVSRWRGRDGSSSSLRRSPAMWKRR